MSVPAPPVPLRVTPPGNVALARARRIVHEGGPTRRDLLYRGYVAALLMVMLGVPLLTGLTSAVPADRAVHVVWAVRAGCALVLVLVALAPTHFGPVITSAGELHHLIDGPFGSRRVLRGRTWTVFGAVEISVLAVVGTVAVGLGLGAVAVATTLAWALGQAALVFLALLGIQTRAAVPARFLALIVGGAGGAVCVAGLRDGWSLAGWSLAGGSLAGGPVDLVGAGVLALTTCLVAVAVPALLGAVPLRVLEHDVRVRHLIRTGVGMGDVRALAVHDGPRRRRLRGRSLPLRGGVLRRSATVSLLELMRTPGRTIGAALVLVLTGLWAGAWAVTWATTSGVAAPHGAGAFTGPGALSGLGAASGPGALSGPVMLPPAATSLLPVLAPVALLGAQWAFAVLSRSLTDVLESLGSGRLDPSPFPRVFLSHLAVPGLVVLAFTAVPATLVIVVERYSGHPEDPSASVVALCLALSLPVLVAPLTGLALAASSSPPVALLTPSPSPFGDTSSLLVVAWMIRGLAPATVLGVVLAVAVGRDLSLSTGLSAGVTALVPLCALAAGVRLRALAHLDLHGRGLAPSSN